MRCSSCVGWGVVADVQRNGADYSVYINTGQEFDGSDSGARPDEAVSWGKLKSSENGGDCVKVFSDATLIFPLIVAATCVIASCRVLTPASLGHTGTHRSARMIRGKSRGQHEMHSP